MLAGFMKYLPSVRMDCTVPHRSAIRGAVPLVRGFA